MTGDLISREALIEALKERGRQLFKLGTSFEANIASVTALECVNIAKDAPAVDAVPVARCSECVHRGMPACPMCHDESYYDEDDGTEYYTVDKTDDNGFCHIGAKMDE